MATTIVFTNLTRSTMTATVSGSGQSWRQTVAPVVDWQQGENPSGAVSLQVSGSVNYTIGMSPSASLMTAPFSTDVTVTLAVFAVDT